MHWIAASVVIGLGLMVIATIYPFEWRRTKQYQAVRADVLTLLMDRDLTLYQIKAHLPYRGDVLLLMLQRMAAEGLVESRKAQVLPVLKPPVYVMTKRGRDAFTALIRAREGSRNHAARIP